MAFTLQKAWDWIIGAMPEKVIFDKEEHQVKASCSIFVKDAGNVISFKEEHEENPYISMLFKELDRETDWMPEQWANA